LSLRDLEKRLQKEPDNLGLKVTVASLLHEAGRTSEAIELYRSVALAYRDAGRKAQAAAVCRSILELAPRDEHSYALLASLTDPVPVPTAPTPFRITGPVESQEPPPIGMPPPREAIKIPTPVPRPPVTPPDAAPARPSSLDETPLPKPVPYHVVDPTTGQNRLSPRELYDADPTRPDAAPTGEDVSEAMATRKVRKLDSEELRKLEKVDFDDGLTPVRDSDEITRPRDKLPDKD
jgi:hypothetical protein